MSNTTTKFLLTVTNPVNASYQRSVVVTGYVTQDHIDRAITTLDDGTPLGLVPDSKGQYLVTIIHYDATPYGNYAG